MTQAGKTEWWRTVLGEHPTGVALITSLDPAGEPTGMVVGTFTAVSQDPPLVGFLPDAASSTFPAIAARGRFAVSVLGAEHEPLCRAFVGKDPDRFRLAAFVPCPSGIPRLADALAWFDVVLERHDRYGDHGFAVGSVDAFGTGSAEAGLPLLFRRGGYGVFAVPAEELDTGTFARRLGAADESAGLLADLADAVGREVVVSTAVRDSVVVLSAARPGGWTGAPGRRRVGDTFPLAAPIAPLFVAWSSPARQRAWIEGARHLVGAVDRPALADLLADVRRRGFGLTGGRGLAERFEEVVGADGPRRESFARLWSDFAAERSAGGPAADLDPAGAAAIQVPVFGPAGEVELVVTVAIHAGLPTRSPAGALIGTMLSAADRLTARLGGIAPGRAAA